MKMKKLLSTGLITLLLPAIAGANLVGQPAPDFSGESTFGTIRLGDYAGKKNVILAFYFADFTPV